MRGRDLGLTAALVAIVAVAAWWFVGRGDVASVDESPAGDRGAPGAIDPARPEAALAGQGRAKPAGNTPAARRILGTPKPVEGASIRGVATRWRGYRARSRSRHGDEVRDRGRREGGTGAENFTDAQGRFVVVAVGDAPSTASSCRRTWFALACGRARRRGRAHRPRRGIA
jgi:hypothetical protein